MDEEEVSDGGDNDGFVGGRGETRDNPGGKEGVVSSGGTANDGSNDAEEGREDEDRTLAELDRKGRDERTFSHQNH